MANYREPQWLLPNEKNLQYPAAGATYGSGLSADRHSLYSMDFDGSSFIDISNDVSVSGDCTVSFWFKVPAVPNATPEVIFARYTGSSDTDFLIIGLYLQGVLASNNSNASGSKTTRSNVTLTADTWYHCAVTKVSGVVTNIYIDGTDRAGSVGSFEWWSAGSTDSGFIGQKANSDSLFDGKIDEVAIFSRALSANEVNDLWNGGSPSNPMLLSGKPVAYYPLGEQARKPGTANWRFPNEVLQGQAINFDGTDHVSAPLNNVFNSATQSTISFWAKKSSSSHEIVLGAGTAETNSIYILWYSNGYVYFGTRATGATGFNINYVFSGSDKLNKWHHFMGVYNAGTASLYINGSLVSGPTSGGPSALGNNIDSTFAIGRLGDVTTYNSTGQMSNIAIWNSDQSTNINNIYNYGAPQTSYTVTPTAWYKLDKTSKFTGLNPNWHSALSFNGAQEINSSSNLNISGASPRTFSAWIKTTDGGVGWHVIVATGNLSNTGGNFELDFRSGKITFNDWGTDTFSGANVNDGNWHHICLTYNGTILKLYIDGVEDTSGDFPATKTINSTNTPIRIGGMLNHSQKFFNGQISNVAIYNQVISPEDVKYLYNGGTPQTNISFEPTSWYKLDNTGTGIQDSGSASNNGTNNGATAISSSVAVDEWVFDNAVQSQTPNWTSALSFDGSSTYATAGTTSYLNGVSEMSVSIWFNLNTAAINNGLISDFIPPNIGHFALITKGISGDNYSFRLSLNDGSGNENSRQITGTEFTAGKWHNLVMTYGSSTIKFYKDGEFIANGPYSPNPGNPPSTFANSTATLNIGRYSTLEWDGLISNAQIWTTELSAADALSIYNNGQPSATAFGSPVSWWKLNDTTIQDSVGSNNGTNNGATEIQTNVWTPRLNGESDTLPSTALVSSDLQFNSAYSSFSLNFDPGGPDYINLGDLSNIGVSNASAASVSLWFKKDGNGNYVLFELKEGSSKIALQSYLTNGLYIYINNISYNVSTTVANGEWHNIILVFDGSKSTNADKLKLYFNGSNITGGTYSGTVPTSVGAFTSSMTSNLGRTPTTAYFDGRMDECSIFNKALNQAEITSIYNNGYPKDITALAPISWWRLGEDAYFDGTDFTIPNKISGAPNGTSDNMTATDLVADAPGSYAAGLGSSLALADRLGDAPLSTANSLSINMTPENRISYPSGYVPTQVDNVYSMDFDGTSDHVLLDEINLGSTQTLSFWINRTANGVAECILGGSNGWGNPGIAVYIETNNYIYFQVNGISAGSKNFGNIFGTRPAGNWYHICISRNGDSTTLYVNGVSVSTVTGFGTGDLKIDAIGAARWANASGYSLNFDGKIDEVAIFDYALSERQIKQDIYNGTTSGKTADLNNNSNLTPPVAWYRMGD